MGKVVFSVILMLVFSNVSQAAKKRKRRRPASTEVGVLVNYESTKYKGPLGVHLYPYGGYLGFKDNFMSCTKKEGGDNTQWECVNEDSGGAAVIEFEEGFGKITVLSYLSNCEESNDRCKDVTSPLKFKLKSKSTIK